MDDLIYLFNISHKFPGFNVSDPENQMIDFLTSTWAEFAKSGYVFSLISIYAILSM